MNDKLKLLQQEHARLVARQKEIIESTPLGEARSEELEAEFQANKGKLNAVNSSIEDVKALSTEEDKLVTVANDIPTPTAAGNDVEVGAYRPESKPWDGQSLQEKFGCFLSAVRVAGAPHGKLDPRLGPLAAASGQSEGVPADGGFLVEKQFVDDVLVKTYQAGEFLNRTERINLSNPNANGLKIKRLKQISRRDGSRWGGLRAYWLAEAGSYTSSTTSFELLELELNKLIGLCYATEELLADYSALGQVIQRAFVEEFRFKVEDACFNGSGAGQPLGILNSNGRVTVAKETAQAATTIVAENIEKMWSRADIRSRQRMVWFINQDTEPQLIGLSKTVGTGGFPLFTPAGSYRDQPFSMIFGRPVIPMEYCATLGTEGDIIFADPMEYLLIDKGAVRSDSSIHVRFLYGETTFRFMYRVDGQPSIKEPLTPYKGSNTTSPFVTLATRS